SGPAHRCTKRAVVTIIAASVSEPWQALGVGPQRKLNNVGVMLDKFKDECGVFGIFGHPEAANMSYLGLYALQHRGQESAGIAASDGEQVRVSRAMGYVADTFDSQALAELPGQLAIGHVR